MKNIMLRKIVLSVTLTLAVINLFAQSGTIKGNVKDASNGEAVIGANIYILGTTQGAAADISGDFEITKVKAGAHTLIVSFVSYKTDTLKGITVYPDQTTVVNTKLVEEAQQLTDVVVTGSKVTNTDVAIITELRKNDLVAVGISAQQISLSQDRDAAQIMKRIPGVTITNNRFVNVRGLSERYSIVLLNGVIAPSTEVDSKAFSFDLIPSNMIDRMLVYKSGSAELPGEFAGAVVNISTKSTVDENSLSVNVTGGYRVATTFNDLNIYKGGNTDWLGFDDGTRQLPNGFPENNLRDYTKNLASTRNVNTLKAAGLSMPNNWSTSKISAAPDLRTTINFSKTAFVGKKKLGNITSFNYSKTYQHVEQENFYYDASDAQSQKATLRYDYSDVRDSETARLGLVSNFIFEFNPKNKIEFRNLYNQQGVSQSNDRSGVEIWQGQDIKNRSLNYWQRSIYSGQLNGKHSLNERLGVSWLFSYSSVGADQPDYRRIRSQRPTGTDIDYAVVIPGSASAQDGRFYSELNEKVYTHALNFDYKFNPQAEEEKQIKLLFGYYLAQTERDFNARWFSFRWFSPSNVDNDLLTNDFQNIFTPENIAPSDGGSPLFVLDEGTNYTDAYTGKNLLTAGYTSLVLPVGNYRLTTGLRAEYNRQQLESFTDLGQPLEVNNPVTRFLPFLNLSYNFNEKSLVRFAYSKTVNRPVFRELAPFNYYDFDRNANITGNKDLKTADIHNLDLRWEMYPSKNETFSLGVFYKKFINPIESNNIGSGNIAYTYANALSAKNFGAEVEIRKSFDGVTNSKFINKFSYILNAAYIYSRVDLGNVTNQIENRALQGQSPYIVNTGLYYNNYENGLQVNASYNVFGPRIFAVGDDDQNAMQYEMPRNQIDLTVSKSFGQNWEVKFGIQDILNQRYRLVQDTNRDEKITGADDKIQSFRMGQYISLGVTYKVF
jgi:TonB-dependent receptor